MNKTDLIEAIAEETGLAKSQATKALDAALGAITKTLAGGGKVALVGFGAFTVSERKARTGRNPRTGEPLAIAARNVAKFKPGKALNEQINS